MCTEIGNDCSFGLSTWPGNCNVSHSDLFLVDNSRVDFLKASGRQDYIVFEHQDGLDHS
jgi:hypothetical protein